MAKGQTQLSVVDDEDEPAALEGWEGSGFRHDELLEAGSWIREQINIANRLPLPGTPDHDLHSLCYNITPPLAWMILQYHNEGNRSKKCQRIERHAEAMSDGRFLLIQQGISFARDGRLNNGQNRLSAVLDSDTTVRMNVTFNESREAFQIIDTGSARTAADTLKMQSYDNATVVSAGARLVWLHRNDNLFSNLSVENDVLASMVGSDRDLFQEAARSAAKVVRKLPRKCTGTAPFTAAFVLILENSRHLDKLETFVEFLAEGVNLTHRDPVLIFREALAQHSFDYTTISNGPNDKKKQKVKVNGTQRNVYLFASIIKTWNHWLVARKVGTAGITWDRGTPFPTPM